MLSLNASRTVGTLLWNVRIPPRQQRTGDLTMALPRRVYVNADDDDGLVEEAEDTILVIFCVGEQCAERMVTAAEWLRGVYIPPVLWEPDGSGRGAKEREVPVWPFFVPPPNWVVKHFTVRTMRRPLSGGSGLGEKEEGQRGSGAPGGVM
jgi:hypothetical protein